MQDRFYLREDLHEGEGQSVGEDDQVVDESMIMSASKYIKTGSHMVGSRVRLPAALNKS